MKDRALVDRTILFSKNAGYSKKSQKRKTNILEKRLVVYGLWQGSARSDDHPWKHSLRKVAELLSIASGS